MVGRARDVAWTSRLRAAWRGIPGLSPGDMVLAQRKPVSLLRFVGVLLLRMEARRLPASSLFQPPPRKTSSHVRAGRQRPASSLYRAC